MGMSVILVTLVNHFMAAIFVNPLNKNKSQKAAQNR
jgi:hypothetical protein